MRIEEELFDFCVRGLRRNEHAAYDRNARLFFGKEGTDHAPFVEEYERDGELKTKVRESYALYITVNGVTMLLAHGMNRSIVIAEAIQSGASSSCGSCSGAFQGVVDKPLEVVAMEVPEVEDRMAKWDVLLLRAQNKGYINSEFVGSLLDAYARSLEKDK